MRFSELFHRSLNSFPDKSKALDLQLLIEAAFHLSRTEFYIKKNDSITDPKGLNKFYGWRRRLTAGEPVSYILTQKEFYGESFYINKHVLIPRPETEILVEQALHLINTPIRILDIGTGSGIIAIILAKRSGSHVTAVDISCKALAVLKKNLRLHQLADQVTPLNADLFPAVEKSFKKFAMIISNPPYIPETEWRELATSVRDYEPKMALVAAAEGLAIIRRIAFQGRHFLLSGGYLLMEIGYNQKESVHTIIKEAGYTEIQFVADYSFIPRVLIARFAG